MSQELEPVPFDFSLVSDLDKRKRAIELDAQGREIVRNIREELLEFGAVANEMRSLLPDDLFRAWWNSFGFKKGKVYYWMRAWRDEDDPDETAEFDGQTEQLPEQAESKQAENVPGERLYTQDEHDQAVSAIREEGIEDGAQAMRNQDIQDFIDAEQKFERERQNYEQQLADKQAEMDKRLAAKDKAMADTEQQFVANIQDQLDFLAQEKTRLETEAQALRQTIIIHELAARKPCPNCGYAYVVDNEQQLTDEQEEQTDELTN